MADYNEPDDFTTDFDLSDSDLPEGLSEVETTSEEGNFYTRSLSREPSAEELLAEYNRLNVLLQSLTRQEPPPPPRPTWTNRNIIGLWQYHTCDHCHHTTKTFTGWFLHRTNNYNRTEELLRPANILEFDLPVLHKFISRNTEACACCLIDQDLLITAFTGLISPESSK